MHRESVACDGADSSKSLTVDNLVAWQRISGQAISDNGKWVACKMEPWEGDAVVNLYDAQGKELATFPRADRFLFSASSDYLVVCRNPARLIVDSLKIKKTKKEKDDRMDDNWSFIRFRAAGK